MINPLSVTPTPLPNTVTAPNTILPPTTGGFSLDATGQNLDATQCLLTSASLTPGQNLSVDQSMQQIMQMLVMLLSTLMQGLGGGAPVTADPTAGLNLTTDPAAGLTNTNTTQPAGGPLRIAQIDSFSSDHGDEIANTLKRGGSNADLAGNVDLLQYDIGNGSEQKINDSLKDIITRIKNGERIDAVNMSLQDFVDNDATAETRTLVDQIVALGVPVAIAAGNNGPEADNFLEGMNSFNVQSATNGVLNASSGLGNVTSEGDTTSFATANLTPLLASLHAQGYSIQQIREFLAQR